MKQYTAIGLMSGTSLDGVDAALLRTDGEDVAVQGRHVQILYPPEIREKVRALFNKAPDPNVERDLTHLNAEAVRALMKAEGLSAADIDLVGYHGQTISHNPERGETCQMGDGLLLSRLLNINVVNDFRTADVKAGGEGAPLVPVYHRAIAARAGKPCAFLNIGGVANVTYVGADGELLACDTGPGNALMDDWMREKTGARFDSDGGAARAGRVHGDILEQLLSHPYFARLAPKSLDRNAFVADTWAHLSTEDGAATLAAFTVEAVARQAQALFPAPPRAWYVCGGGRHNAFLIEKLQAALKTPVEKIESLGLNGDATEAEAFAYLAVRSLRGLPLSYPGTTGVPHPMQGGRLHVHAGHTDAA